MILDVFAEHAAAQEFLRDYVTEHRDTTWYKHDLMIRKDGDIVRRVLLCKEVRDVDRVRGLEFSRVVHHQPVPEEAYAVIEGLVR